MGTKSDPRILYKSRLRVTMKYEITEIKHIVIQLPTFLSNQELSGLHFLCELGLKILFAERHSY